MTKTEKIIKGLQAMGAEEVKSATNKYRCFTGGRLVKYYFVGRSGAIRVNNTNKITDSFSLSDATKAAIIKKGEEQPCMK